MANTFKNSISASIGITETTIYTAPAATVTTVIGVSVANRVNQNINVDVKLNDTTGGKSAYICTGSLVPPGSNIVLVGGDQKVVLKATDYLTLKSNVASSADIIISVLEIS
jgi:hypothetical protein